MTKILDHLADAANRLMRGDDDGITWVWHHVMSDGDHIKFDGFLVQTGDVVTLRRVVPVK